MAEVAEGEIGALTRSCWHGKCWHLIVAGRGPQLQQLLEGGHLAAVGAARHVQPVLVQSVPRRLLQIFPKHHLRQLLRARQRPLVLCHTLVLRVDCTATGPQGTLSIVSAFMNSFTMSAKICHALVLRVDCMGRG